MVTKDVIHYCCQINFFFTQMTTLILSLIAQQQLVFQAELMLISG